MKVVIMAGGKGTRISSVASDIPKPMIKIEGIPVLEREIECLKEQGFDDIIIKMCIRDRVTNKDNVILPQQYEALTSFVDLAIEDLDAISYDMDGHVQVKFTCELTVGMDEEDLALMTIDQETKEMKYLELDKFDEKTGEITVTFENLGPFVVKCV